MKTFRDETEAGDETRWFYDQATGLLTNKVYADGQGPSYTYTPDGKLVTRTWARGVTTSYAYDYTGALTNIVYSDDTPDVTFQYDRLGRQKVAQTFLSAHRYAYDPATLALATETIIDLQTATTNVLTRATDALGRDIGFCLAGSNYAVTYGFDAYGRFHSVSSSVRSMRPHSGKSVSSVVQYSYLSGTHLLATMTNSSAFSWARTFETHRDLIASVENRFGENMISAFDYANDSLARRTRRVDNGSVTNEFGYNVRSEVTGALMGTNTYSYIFDPIGNRLAATNNLEGWVYQANPLNQYTNIADGVIMKPEHDLDGNMTATGGGWRYVWNGENRMILASNAQHIVPYAYDHQGRMVAKTVDGSPPAIPLGRLQHRSHPHSLTNPHTH